MSVSSNSGSSAPIPIPKAKPPIESWFAAQLECYKEPLEILFKAVDAHMNVPIRNLVIGHIQNEMEKKDSDISKALMNLYDVIRTKCVVKEDVVLVRHAEIPVINALEEITNSLFDFDRYLKHPSKTTQNVIRRIDFLEILAKKIIFVYEKRILLRSFMLRTFGSNNSFNDVLNINRRTYSNLSNTSSASAASVESNSSIIDYAIPFEGGTRRKRNKTVRKNRRVRKTRRS